MEPVAVFSPIFVSSAGGPEARSRGSRRGRALATLLFLVVLAAAGRDTVRLARMVVETPRLPQWDMARRGVDGLQLTDALRRGDAAGFLRQVNESSVWPPLYTLLEASAFLIFGDDYRVPRLLVCGLFFLSIPAIFWAGCALGGERGPWVGLLAAAFLAASPEFHLYATLNMLEVPGALLLMLCLGAYCRALGSSDPGRWRLAWSLATALFFLKFNYGLMWLVPVLALEAWPARGAWRAAWAAAAYRLRAVEWRRPWPAFVLCYLALVGGILLAGGLEAEVAGEKLRVRSLGSPLYILYVVSAARFLARPRRSFARWRRWLAGLAPRHRQLVVCVALPIAVWMLVPPHARDFFHFVGNRSSEMGLLTWESLAFYPRAWMEDYSASAGIGALLLVLAFLPCLAPGRLDPRARVLAAALLFAGAAVVLHPYKLPRFAFTVAPLVWLSAALVLARGCAALEARWFSRIPPVAVLALGVAVTAASLGGGADPNRLYGAFVYRTVSPAVEDLLDDVLEVARREESVAILGTWNRLSPWLLEWHAHRRDPELEPRRIPAAVDLGGESLCEDLTAGALVVLDPLPGRRPTPVLAEYAEEIAPHASAYAALVDAECLRLAAEKTYPKAGYRARLYRRTSSDPLR